MAPNPPPRDLQRVTALAIIVQLETMMADVNKMKSASIAQHTELRATNNSLWDAQLHLKRFVELRG